MTPTSIEHIFLVLGHIALLIILVSGDTHVTDMCNHVIDIGTHATAKGIVVIDMSACIIGTGTHTVDMSTRVIGMRSGIISCSVPEPMSCEKGYGL